MNREEALGWLKGELDMLEAAKMASPEWRDELREVIAALESTPPCACGERELLAITDGFVAEIEGDDGIWRVVAGTFQEQEGATVSIRRWRPAVRLILPAEE